MTLITNSHAKYLLMLEKAKEIWRRDMREVEGKMVPVAKFTAVIEALKVRGISKQSGGLFYLKPLQSALLRHLAKKRQFIVGKVETPENLLTAVGGIIDPMLKHLSVDYEASTDYLKSVFSRIASEVIFRDCHVGQVAREMWSKSLYGGAVTLSDEPDGDSDPKLIKKFGRERCGIKLQKRGQLMGNIMSFPILCLCSAFVLWKTQCFANRKRIHPCDGDFAVNGDDGYMQTTDRGYAYWKRIGTKLGLKPSVGKVYFSSSFFDFNSSIFGSWQPTVIYPSGVFGPGPLRLMRFRFLPIGLAYGTMRTGSVMVSEMLSLDALSKGKSAGSIVRCILSLAEHKQRLRVWDVVYRKLLYVPSIYSKIRGIPWFLPESVGGLGLPPAYRRPIQSSFEVGQYDPSRYETILLHGRQRTHRIVLGPSDTDLRSARVMAFGIHEDQNPLPSRPKPFFDLSTVELQGSSCGWSHRLVDYDVNGVDEARYTFYTKLSYLRKRREDKLLQWDSMRLDERDDCRRPHVLAYVRRLRELWSEAEFVSRHLEPWLCCDDLVRQQFHQLDVHYDFDRSYYLQQVIQSWWQTWNHVRPIGDMKQFVALQAYTASSDSMRIVKDIVMRRFFNLMIRTFLIAGLI